MGNSRIIFSRFSFSSGWLFSKNTFFQDQKSSRQYFRSPSGVRVNTVEAKAIPRKTNSANPAAA